MDAPAYQVHDDVLLTQNGTAFLIGGNHSVLKYIKRELKPTAESLNNFHDNISKRAALSAGLGIPYQHVIFPDKQSVLQDEFPIPNTCRLADEYILGALAPIELSSHILYPADQLASATYPTYLKLDTHLSDHGSLLVFSLILKRLGVDVPDIIKHLSARIIDTKTTCGDLGSKFSPPLKQVSTSLSPDWAYTVHSSQSGYNNGQVDIYMASSAPVSGRILIFGDSFFRLMLPFFSRVFQQTVFLRSPFLHPEMIEFIKPNYLLTGNAERYLANVTSDNNASPFFLYSLFNCSGNKEDRSFLNTYRSILTPELESSKSFTNKLLSSTSSDKLIVGPSHIVRWKNHRRHGLLDTPCDEGAFVGFGGAPIWSKRLFESAVSLAKPEQEILYMVPDFRFGNSVAVGMSELPAGAFLDGHSGIDSKALTLNNDRLMYQLCMKALPHWRNKFPNTIRFCFWDLLCRQIQDRLLKKHVSTKKYVHPVWNLKEIQDAYPTENVIDLTPLLGEPMHELNCLYIDSSSHPSQIGYKTIENCFIHKMDALSAYTKARNDVSSQIIEASQRLILTNKPFKLLTGSSVWLDTLARYLGQKGIQTLIHAGICIKPSHTPPAYPVELAEEFIAAGDHDIIYISENGVSADHSVASPHRATNHVKFIAWEASCDHVIRSRNERPQSVYGNIISPTHALGILVLNDEDVELGPFGYPTINGLLKVLSNI
jgi:hypothetical protein